MITLKAVTMLLALACFALLAEKTVAQESAKEKQVKEVIVEKQAKPLSTYRLEFSLREVEDSKRLNARSYTMLVDEDVWGRIRVASRVPVATGKEQFQYVDVGVNIDCRIRERESHLLLEATIEISSFVSPEQPAAVPSSPVMRTVRSQISAAIPPGKPTLISTADDTATKHRYEVEVTAAKVK
jgi:hypothetical protein